MKVELPTEYPKGFRFGEMCLVDMLREKRSWHDKMNIISALMALRSSAKAMVAEKDHLSPLMDSVEESKRNRKV